MCVYDSDLSTDYVLFIIFILFNFSLNIIVRDCNIYNESDYG